MGHSDRKTASVWADNCTVKYLRKRGIPHGKHQHWITTCVWNKGHKPPTTPHHEKHDVTFWYILYGLIIYNSGNENKSLYCKVNWKIGKMNLAPAHFILPCSNMKNINSN